MIPNANATAPQTTQAAAPAPVEAGKAKTEATKKHDAFVNDGSTQRNSMTEEQKAQEGSKSGAVSFVAALGNPLRSGTRKQDGEDHPTLLVIGYSFQVNEPITIARIPLAESPKNVIDVDNTKFATEQVQAGTTINLNLVETGWLISRIEFAGSFTGGAKPVILSSKHSDANPDPLPILQLAARKGSIKENIIPVADVQKKADGRGFSGYTMKPGYEAFEPLLKRKKPVRPGSAGKGGAKAGETAKNIAAAFRSLYSEKFGA
jgi:hypothetical protein